MDKINGFQLNKDTNLNNKTEPWIIYPLEPSHRNPLYTHAH